MKEIDMDVVSPLRTWLERGNRLVIRLDWEASKSLRDATGVDIEAAMLDFEGFKVKTDGHWSPPLPGHTEISVETEV
jgi:hypothetical protein